jgi:type II secretion system protein N
MKNILKTILFCLFILIVFLIWTFPYSRLGPKIQSMLERDLQQMLGVDVQCNISDFDFALPLGFKWEDLNCKTGETTLFELKKARLSILFHQTLTGELTKGRLTLGTNLGFKSPPDRLKVEFENADLQPISRFTALALHRLNAIIPTTLDFSGILTGQIDIPLKNFRKEKGNIDLLFTKFRFPAQPFLDLIGLKGLDFNKSAIRANLEGGRLSIKDASFLSDVLSGKAEGSIDLLDDVMKSAAALTLKWKIQKNNALMNAPIGQLLANFPCPNADSDGFCSKKINRLADLSLGF